MSTDLADRTPTSAVRGEGPSALVVDGVTKTYRSRGRRPQDRGGRRRRVVHHRARRRGVAGGRQRQRQEHDREADHRPRAADVRVGRGPATSTVGKLRGRALRNYRHDVQMVFQDPYGALEPVAHRGVHAHPTVRELPRHVGARREAAGRRAARDRRPDAARAVRAQASAPALRWPTPTRGDRAGSCLRPRADRGRRTGVDARRVASGGRPPAARRPARRARAVAALHHPRPAQRPRGDRPDPRAPPRPHRRTRGHQGRASAPEGRLHRGPARRDRQPLRRRSPAATQHDPQSDAPAADPVVETTVGH